MAFSTANVRGVIDAMTNQAAAEAAAAIEARERAPETTIGWFSDVRRDDEEDSARSCSSRR